MTTTIQTLPNGVRVLVVNMPHTESVSVAAFVHTGSRNETSKNNGISHFLEHMAFKGTKTRDYMKISSDVERLGADINAYTSKDTTVYYVSGLAKHMPVFVDLIGDILLNSELPEDEIERERGVILQELNRYADSASSTAYNLYDKASYPKDSFGMSILGPKANIKRFTRQDFQDYIANQYTGANVIVGIAGNVSTEEAVKLAEQHFGALPAGQTNVVTAPNYVGGIEVSKKAKFTQTQIVMGFPGRNSVEDYYADMLAASVIGDGMSCPLFNEVREKRGLVYSVGSYFMMNEHLGQFLITAGTTEEHIDEFFKVTCDVLKQHTDQVNEIDLERAVNMQSVFAIRSLERPFKVLENNSNDLFTYGKIHNVKDYLESLQNVTIDQVKASMARMIANTPTIAMVGKGSDESYLQKVYSYLR